MRLNLVIIISFISLALLLIIFPVSAKSSRISEINSDFVPGEIIIKMRPYSPGSSLRTLSFPDIVDSTSLSINSARKLTKTDFNVRKIDKIPSIDGTYIIKFDSREQMNKILEEYRSNSNIEYAEPNYIYHLFAVANDTHRDLQWSLNITNATSAWDIERGNKSTIIAIIDTGVEYNHTDLTGNIWNNTDEIPGNGIDDDGNGYNDDIRGWNFYANNSDPMDDNGHGTHVAGIAAAVSNNSIGVSGVCWNCTIMPIKAGSSTTIYSANASIGIIYAADNGADIISMSFGSTSDSSTIRNAINYAYGKGAVLVASAGNVPQMPAGVKVYPAAYDNVISVSATENSDSKASYSQYGSWIDVAAPGGDGETSSDAILSTYTGNDYGSGDGTSMSAPFVSGLVGLILSKNSSLSQEQILTIIHSSTNNVSSSYYIGTGRVNVFDAISRNQTTIARLNGSLDDVNVSGIISINGTANGTGLANFSLYYGSGIYPIAWTLINTSNQTINNSVLTTWNTESVSDGTYSIMLSVIDSLNQTSTDKLVLQINNTMQLLSQNIASCQNLDVENEVYNLTGNVSSSGTCFNVTANNITLECNEFTINYSQSEVGYAVNNTGYNYTSIRNCKIVQGSNQENSTGIFFNESERVNVINNTIHTNGSLGYGIYMESSSQSNLSGNTIITDSIGGYGINLQNYSNNNSLINNTISTNGSYGIGIYLYASSDNTEIHNNFIDTNGTNSSGIYSYFSSNSIISNSTISTKGSNGYGLYIEAYSSYNNLINNTISTNGTGGNGIFLNHSSDYNNVTNNNIETNGSSNSGIVIYYSSNYNNLTNNTISTNGSNGYGINVYMNSIFNILANNNVSTKGEYGFGIKLSSASNCTFTNNTISTNGSESDGIWLFNGSDSILIDNIIATNEISSYGIFLFDDSNYNNVSNNSISTNGSGSYGIGVAFSNYSTIQNNTIFTNGTSSSGISIQDGCNFKILNNTIETKGTTSHGLNIYASSEYNNATSNLISTNGTDSNGISIYANSIFNRLSENTITSKQSYGIYLDYSGDSIPKNNTIYNNLINGSAISINFSDGFPTNATNFWNTSNQTGNRTYGNGNRMGGNYYTNSSGTGYSDTCDDLDGDGFCDSAYNVTSDSACSGETCGNNTDYLALSTKFGVIPPTITYSISPKVVINGTNVTITASTPNLYIDKIWANITLPDSSKERINLTNNTGNSFNATLNGTYDVTFFANNTFGNISNISASFIAQPHAELSLNITNSSSGATNVNVTIYFNGSIVASNSTSNGLLVLPIANYTYDVSFEPYSKALQIMVTGVNLSQNNSLSIGFDRPTVSGYLTAYAVSYNLTPAQNANVTINYTEAGYTNENYLSIYKCDNWNFTNRSCPSGGWSNITSGSTKNTTSHSFMVSVTSFSGFAIWQDSFCGNLVCENTETCSNCPGDCGSCSSSPSGDSGITGSSTTTTTFSNTTTTSTIENNETTTTSETTTTVSEEANLTSQQSMAGLQIDFTPLIIMLGLLGAGVFILYIVNSNKLRKYMEKTLSDKSSLYSDFILLEKSMLTLKNSGHDVSKIESEIALAKRAIESEAFQSAKIHMENAKGMMRAYD